MTESTARRPRLVGWGVTERCNLSCPHCYASASRTPCDELTGAECLALLEALAAMGAERIGWTGGEPLLRPDLEALIGRATALGIESGLTTNGVPMTPRRAEALRRAGLTSVQISLDGSTSERNRLIRGASAREFDRVIAAIRLCRGAGFRLHMAMLVGRATLDDVRPYVDLAAAEGVGSIRFCGFVPWGGGRGGAARARLDLRGRLAELRALILELQERESPVVMFDPGFGPLPPDFTYHDCIAGMEMLYLSPSGDVYPCTSLLDARFRAGNVRERRLEEIWADPRMRQIALRPKATITGACRDCEAFERCGGGCRGITYAYTGDLDASFPACLARAEPVGIGAVSPSLAAAPQPTTPRPAAS